MMKKETIKGYKAFILKDDKLTDRFGNHYELNKKYHVDGEIKFRKSGFHMCSYPEDTLRYVDAYKDDVKITKVIGSGIFNKYDDDYSGYVNMYAVSDLEILKICSRKELLDYEINNFSEIDRFISGFNLSIDEINYLIDHIKNKEKLKIAREELIRFIIINYINYFPEFIDKISINDNEIVKVFSILNGYNLDQHEKSFIKYNLGKQLEKDNIRRRK